MERQPAASDRNDAAPRVVSAPCFIAGGCDKKFQAEAVGEAECEVSAALWQIRVFQRATREGRVNLCRGIHRRGQAKLMLIILAGADQLLMPEQPPQAFNDDLYTTVESETPLVSIACDRTKHTRCEP